MGAIALPLSIDTEPNARPVVTMVATRDSVLAVEMHSTLSGEPDAVATALHQVIEDAMRLTGTRPLFLNVVHQEEAEALAPLLDGSGIDVRSLGIFDRLSDPARAMVEDLSGAPIWPPMSMPDTWSAWGLPEADVAALFRAAAEFFRAAPWTLVSEGTPLIFRPREGSPWAGAVLGQGGDVFGLALYPEAEELMYLLEDAYFAEDGLDSMGERAITVLFERAQELPRPMQREVAGKGWPVASPSGYPTLAALNTPGGGVTRSDLRKLTEALSLVPRFLEAGASTDPDEALLPTWTSPETGTVVSELFDMEPDFPPLVLEPGYAQGPAARPGSFVALDEDLGDSDRVHGFEEVYQAGIDHVNEFGSSLLRDSRRPGVHRTPPRDRSCRGPSGSRGRHVAGPDSGRDGVPAPPPRSGRSLVILG